MKHKTRKPEPATQKAFKPTNHKTPHAPSKLLRQFSSVEFLDSLQTKINTSPIVQNQARLQRLANESPHARPIQKSDTDGGLPGPLKAGIESLSGISMEGVKVHRNSSSPAKVGAHAYAQGADIHLGPGQDKHLPHEAWHVVQQAQGRVKPTLQAKGVAINDDPGLEHEADVMGDRALSLGTSTLQQESKFATGPSVKDRTEIQFQTTFGGSTAMQHKSALRSLPDLDAASLPLQLIKVGDEGASPAFLATKYFDAVWGQALAVLKKLQQEGTDFDNLEALLEHVRKDPSVAPHLPSAEDVAEKEKKAAEALAAENLEREEREALVAEKNAARKESEPICKVEGEIITEYDVAGAVWRKMGPYEDGGKDRKDDWVLIIQIPIKGTKGGLIEYKFHVHPPNHKGQIPMAGAVSIGGAVKGETPYPLMEIILKMRGKPATW